MTDLDSILKSRDITLPTRVYIVKAIVFPVVMYGCESWTVKKAECQKIDAFELWCWRRLLRVPWTARRSNQSILKEINPEYSLEELMAEAEAPTLWPPDVKSQLIRKDPDAGKDSRQSEKGMTEHEMVGWHHWLNGHEFEQALGDSEGQGSLAWGHKELDMGEQLSNNNHRDFLSSFEFPSLKHKEQRTFLVVEWLRLHTPNAGGPGLIPGQGTRSYMLQLRPGTAK